VLAQLVEHRVAPAAAAHQKVLEAAAPGA